MKKKYTVNVHYDYVATVEFIADEDKGDDIYAIASELAMDTDVSYVGETDSCCCDEEDVDPNVEYDCPDYTEDDDENDEEDD